MGGDWETEMVLNVVARKGRQALKASTGDDSESGTCRINKALMDKVLLQLSAGASEDEMESKLEVVIAQFLQGKEKKFAARQKSPLKMQDMSSSKDGKRVNSAKVAVEQPQSEDTHPKLSSEDDESSFEKASAETEVDQSQSDDIKAEAKRQAHLLWQRVYGRKPILCDDLEQIIPDTLTTSKKWIEMDSCDPKKDYISEWNMKWDCEDDDDENWDQEKRA